MWVLPIVVCLIASCTGAASDDAPDNRGTEFVIGFMDNGRSNVDTRLFITTASSENVQVRVTSPKFFYKNAILIDETFDITYGELKALDLDHRIVSDRVEFDSKGILIEATDEITVYTEYRGHDENDGYLALPTNVLGTEYISVSYYPSRKETQFLIIATEDDTTVEITMPDDDQVELKYLHDSYMANDVFNVTMDRFDSFQVQAHRGDLTGAYIKANKPVAFFSGNEETNVLPDKSYDHLVEQIPPISTWGKTFAFVSTPERTVGDVFRFVAAKDDTTISVTCSGGFSSSFVINARQHEDIDTLRDGACWAQASEGVMVVQFIKSQTDKHELTDPSMIVIYPVEQFASAYSFTTPISLDSKRVYQAYVTLVIKESEKDGLRLDGEPLPSSTFVAVPNTDLVGTYVPITEGAHILQHINPIHTFGGIIYGSASKESYGMPLGTRMDSINEVCTPSASQLGDGIDNDCDGLIDEELCAPATDDVDEDGDGNMNEDCAQINGDWGQWGAWDDCSVTCSMGIKTRTRECNDLTPQGVGFYCWGADNDVAECDTDIACPSAPDSRGTEFILGFMENEKSKTEVELFITTSRVHDVNVRVTSPKHFDKNGDMTVDVEFTVTAGYIHNLELDSDMACEGTEMSSKGIYIEADDEVVVYGTNLEKSSNDGFLGLPVDVLGLEYYTVVYSPSKDDNELLIVATEDDTEVQIHLPNDDDVEIKVSKDVLRDSDDNKRRKRDVYADKDESIILKHLTKRSKSKDSKVKSAKSGSKSDDSKAKASKVKSVKSAKSGSKSDDSKAKASKVKSVKSVKSAKSGSKSDDSKAKVSKVKSVKSAKSGSKSDDSKAKASKVKSVKSAKSGTKSVDSKAKASKVKSVKSAKSGSKSDDSKAKASKVKSVKSAKSGSKSDDSKAKASKVKSVKSVKSGSKSDDSKAKASKVKSVKSAKSGSKSDDNVTSAPKVKSVKSESKSDDSKAKASKVKSVKSAKSGSKSDDSKAKASKVKSVKSAKSGSKSDDSKANASKVKSVKSTKSGSKSDDSKAKASKVKSVKSAKSGSKSDDSKAKASKVKSVKSAKSGSKSDDNVTSAPKVKSVKSGSKSDDSKANASKVKSVKSAKSGSKSDDSKAKASKVNSVKSAKSGSKSDDSKAKASKVKSVKSAKSGSKSDDSKAKASKVKSVKSAKSGSKSDDSKAKASKVKSVKSAKSGSKSDDSKASASKVKSVKSAKSGSKSDDSKSKASKVKSVKSAKSGSKSDDNVTSAPKVKSVKSGSKSDDSKTKASKVKSVKSTKSGSKSDDSKASASKVKSVKSAKSGSKSDDSKSKASKVKSVKSAKSGSKSDDNVTSAPKVKSVKSGSKSDDSKTKASKVKSVKSTKSGSKSDDSKASASKVKSVKSAKSGSKSDDSKSKASKVKSVKSAKSGSKSDDNVTSAPKVKSVKSGSKSDDSKSKASKSKSVKSGSKSDDSKSKASKSKSVKSGSKSDDSKSKASKSKSVKSGSNSDDSKSKASNSKSAKSGYPNKKVSKGDYEANDIITLNMDRFDTFQAQSKKGDLTGAHITSNKPIAVFSGNVRAYVLPKKSYDHLVEQLLPVGSWGKTFAIVPTPERTNTGDTIRFVGAVADTKISVTCSDGLDEILTVNDRQYQQIDIASEAMCYAEATEGIMVALFVKSETDHREPTDPSMILIPPIGQYGAAYSFTTPKNSRKSRDYQSYVNFVVREVAKDGLLLDGMPLPVDTIYNPIPQTQMVGGFVKIHEGAHTLVHESPIQVFGAILYGATKEESYGMPLGLRLADINVPCFPSTMSLGDGINNDCDEFIDEELCGNGIDDDGDGVEDEDCAPNPPVNGNWTTWSRWSDCSEQCGDVNTVGEMSRTRDCTNPEPSEDGLGCVGNATEIETCSPTTLCSVDGIWGQWEEWTPCSVSCASGTRQRYRYCDDPEPYGDGDDCAGDDFENAVCDTKVVCPVDGGFSPWSLWSSCSVTCGTGTKDRSRLCDNPAPQNDGDDCSGDTSETAACDEGNCPVDGGLSVWSTWSSCSVTCGTGTKDRSRSCDNPAPQNSGDDCSGDTSETEACDEGNCPVDGGFSDWGAWSSCPVTCGTAAVTRERECNNPTPQHGGVDCVGDTSETQSCDSGTACVGPVDGGFSVWSSWSSCSVTCGAGTKDRSRSCDNPAPQNSGEDCSGDTSETEACDEGNCPVDGGFSDWATWSSCSVTCGTGTKNRSRSCDNPAPQNGGDDCSGDTSETEACDEGNCPSLVDGGFSDWSTWSSCSVSCGTGTKDRSRSCDNPAPQNGGDDCSGDTDETEACDEGNCPVDGGFSDWGTWSSCPVTCGTAVVTRERECNNPTPQHGGVDCVGDTSENQSCDSGTTCVGPVDGGFSDWSTWTSCSVTCGTGTKDRSRSCDNPAPENGGDDCSGDTSETEACDEGNCPVDGGFSDWGTWSSCPVTCGTAVVTRERECNNPSPQHGGVDCVGDTSETQSCDSGTTCVGPVDGGFSSWSTWSACSVTCSTGVTTRSRSCNSPQPQNGGANCSGNFVESTSCDAGSCSGVIPDVDGSWGDWLPWIPCTKTCGGGITMRTRECSNPEPSGNGQFCEGTAFESGPCNTANCPSPYSGIAGDYVNKCPAGFFTCKAGSIVCIQEIFRCDCASDCDDSSDENEAWGACTAEIQEMCLNSASVIGSWNGVLMILLAGHLLAWAFRNWN